MPFVLADRVKETTITTGTGTITLAGAAAGFQSFAAVGDGNQTFYAIVGQIIPEWEVGVGTYTSSGTTLSRDQVLSSSNSGAAVPFSAGTKDVFVTYPASKNVISTVNETDPIISFNYTIQSGRNGTSAGPATVTAGGSVAVPTGQRWLIFG